MVSGPRGVHGLSAAPPVMAVHGTERENVSANKTTAASVLETARRVLSAVQGSVLEVGI